MIKSKGNEEFKQKLVLLNSQTNYPSVTLLIPVSPGEFGGGSNSPEKLIKDLIRDAHNKLSNLGDDKVRETVKEKLNNIIEKIKFEEDTLGVAVFLSSEHEEIIALPFTVESKVYVGYSFQVRDLVFAMNRLVDYMVLHISEKKVMTLRGSGAKLSMINVDEMPSSLSDLGNVDKDHRYTDQHVMGSTSGGNFVTQGVQEDQAEVLKQFILKIDHALTKYLSQENLRVVVIGVEKKLGYFNKFSKNLDKVIATVTGNYDHASSKAIGDLVWPEVQSKIAEEKEASLSHLEEAVGRTHYVSGLNHAWVAASEGRIKTLYVEKEFQCPAILSEDGLMIDINIKGKTAAPELLKEDVVDDLIELVLSKGGDVVFLENGKLNNHQQLAAITRY